jgi:hypothetical protein
MAESSNAVPYPVPRILWESLESVFANEARRYVKELAGILDVPADKLIAKVLPKKSTIKIYLQDTPTENEDLACNAFCTQGSIAARCRAPILLGSNYCVKHHTFRPEVNTSIEGTTYLTKLNTDSNLPALWYDKDGTVYDANLAMKGHYDSETGTLYIC